MYHYTILRLLFASFLLYFAWPYIPEAATQIEKVFWGGWLVFLVLVVGGNLATVLQLSELPVMEQKMEVDDEERKRRRDH